ncbi:MAG: hypothetical protein AB7G35_22975 [Hyphomicrobiaceae bacterium]
MVARTQITMTPELGRRARRRAAELGVSFAEYVRRVVRNDLGETGPKPNVSVLFDLVTDGPPSDIARDKDRMVAEAVGKAPARKTAHSVKRRR